mgnify:FL=1|tara:strand:- start:119 stop:463 length:345 start_codon:yes stop_codon:yes gene_type:complete
MNNNTYEIALVVSPELRTEEIDSQTMQFIELLEKNGSKHIHTGKTKSKKLSYPINNFIEASYVYIIFDSNPDSINLYKKWASDNPSILRHLVIKLTQGELKFRENNILNQAVSE